MDQQQDFLYSKLNSFADLPRRERYIQTYRTLIRSLPLRTRESMKQHLSEYWNISPEVLKKKRNF